MDIDVSDALPPAAWIAFGTGLAGAFVITSAIIVLLIVKGEGEKKQGIDQGFVGLMILLLTIFFLVAFSFLIAASVRGIDIKLMTAAVDGLILLGSKLLAKEFLIYLSDGSLEDDAGGGKPQLPKPPGAEVRSADAGRLRASSASRR